MRKMILLMLINSLLLMFWNCLIVSRTNNLILTITGHILSGKMILMINWWIGIKNLLIYLNGLVKLVILTYYWKCRSSLFISLLLKWVILVLFKIPLSTLRSILIQRYWWNTIGPKLVRENFIKLTGKIFMEVLKNILIQIYHQSGGYL